MSRDAPPRIGVSACLLGQEVRYDGGHKRDRFLTDVLGRYVEWVPVCPEVEAGMGVPRPSLRLVRRSGGIRLLEKEGGRDHTASMQRTASRRLAGLARLDLCGYVLKRGSPSCGMERVAVYGARGRPRREGRGLFAAALLEALPSLPVEEEGRLYERGFMEALAKRATPARNASGLQHMARHLRDGLDRDARAELAETIHDYRCGLVPLVVLLTLLRHHARRLRVGYLLDQTHLEPDPAELMLRNHV